jgi:uncharacterized protein
MLTFLSIVLSVYGSMYYYAFSKLWQLVPHTSGWLWTLALVGVILTLSPLLLWQLGKLNYHGATALVSWIVYLWMAYLFLFCSLALVADASRFLAMLTGFTWNQYNNMIILNILFFAFILSGIGLVSARQIKLEKISIATPKLSPAIGKVSIVQISDLHLGAMLGEEFLQHVIEKIQQLQPDIIVATGDILDGQGDELDKLAQQFHALKPPNGLFAVTGNHEYFAGLDTSLRFLNSAGFTVLRGETVATGGIVLAGVDDSSTAGMLDQDIKADTTQALASVNKNEFIVLLKHQPVIGKEDRFDLQLSGHVHGGQIFPFGFLTRMVYGVATGLTRLADGHLLYVSRGTGTWGPPIRLFAAPEITLITITSESKK